MQTMQMGEAMKWFWVGVWALGLMGGGMAAEGGRVFSSPEAAVDALVTAVAAEDRKGLESIFGPSLAALENPDAVQAAEEYKDFAAAAGEARRLAVRSEGVQVLEVGASRWPFPIPLVQRAGGWVFDTNAGVEEVRNRRIGKNELAVLEVLRAYVEAQRDYARRDRDGDEVLEYAQSLVSSPGRRDGLYWPLEWGGEASPLGPLVAEAQAMGYRVRDPARATPPAPFHGYFFKILVRQGKHAPGGKYDYVINGNMIGGFAMVAWPAEYGETGVMTFVVSQQGRVYQRDLGQSTSRVAARMRAYDPDRSWQASLD